MDRAERIRADCSQKSENAPGELRTNYTHKNKVVILKKDKRKFGYCNIFFLFFFLSNNKTRRKKKDIIPRRIPLFGIEKIYIYSCISIGRRIRLSLLYKHIQLRFIFFFFFLETVF